ncbi:MAG: hypothetical protein NTV37_09745 [Proteobacteria bacterium]|nr:hypothetical protein [Pseudomonadota bacterium]
MLATIGGDAEGLDFTPQAFSNISAGMLVVVSKWTGQLNVIASNGTMIHLGLHSGTPEILSFVPLNLGFSGNPLEGFHAANYSYNAIKAGARKVSAYKGNAVPLLPFRTRSGRIRFEPPQVCHCILCSK